MDKTIRPKFDKGRTQSVSIPTQKKLALKKPYMPPKAEEGAEVDNQTQIMGDLPPSLYLVTGSSSKDFPLDPNEYVTSIGKDRKADITIEDNVLSPIHLMIVKMNEECLFMDRGKRDILKFDGIQTRQACKSAESRLVIRLGKHWLIYDATKLTSDTVSFSRELAKPNELTQESIPGKVTLKFRNKVFETTKDTCLIGTHQICDIRLHGEAVADFTGMVNWGKDGVYFEKMGACRASVNINGKRVSNMAKLADGDVLSIGRDEIVVSFDGEIEERAYAMFHQVEEKPELALTILGGTDADTIPLVMNRMCVIGRSSSADIHLDSPSVSRAHAKVMVREKFLSVTDNESYNKVKVNMEEVEKAMVFAGDILELGDCALLVHYNVVRF